MARPRLRANRGASGSWTVEPGRHLSFNGETAFRIASDDNDVRKVPHVAVDGAAHLIADLFNKNGVTIDSLYEKHMGGPRRGSGPLPGGTKGWHPLRENDDEETPEMWIDASDNEAPWLAQHWYSGQGDPLYALSSAGFPQPESTVAWALRNAKESEAFQWKEMEKTYGKKGIQKLMDIDPESREARALPAKKKEDLEATDEISRLVYALQEALDHGERISKDEGWAAHGKTR